MLKLPRKYTRSKLIEVFQKQPPGKFYKKLLLLCQLLEKIPPDFIKKDPTTYIFLKILSHFIE